MLFFFYTERKNTTKKDRKGGKQVRYSVRPRRKARGWEHKGATKSLPYLSLYNNA